MNTQSLRKSSTLVIAALVAVIALGLMTAPAYAATITVNSTSSAVNATDGLCTLVEAIIAANTDTASGGVVGECPAGSGADVIELSNATYTFTASSDATDGANALPSITTDITINGNGATLTRSGTNIFRYFHVASGGILRLNSMTLNNGRAATGGGNGKQGGAIRNSGTLQVTSVTFTNNSAGNSSARGGAIYSNGTGTVSSSSFSGNTSTIDGGGIHNASGSFTVTNSSLSSNTPANCFGTITNGGGNTADDTSCGFGASPSSLSINNVTVNESDAGGSFTVTLSPSSASTVTVDYTFNNGSATNGADFNGTNGTLTFNPGDTSRSINFTLINDSLAEGTETFTVTLSNATNATIGTGTGTGTINDDEGTPTLNINSVTVGEADGSGSLTVTLSPASAGTVTVNYTFNNGSATNGADFNGTNGSLTFNSGETSKAINFTLINDSDVEGTETFTVTLDGASGASIGTGTGTVTINDDESGLTLNINSVTVNEGDGSGSLTVTLSAVSAGTVTVDYTFNNGSATNGADFNGTNGTLTFNPGVTSQNINFTLIDDALAEGVETFTVTLSNASGASIGTGTGTVTINDNEAVAGLSIADVTINETAGAGVAVVTLSPANASIVTVDYTIADITATAGLDYTATMTGTLTFNPGDTTQTIAFFIIDDALKEGTERFSITLSNSSGPAIAVATAIISIIDDEMPAPAGRPKPEVPPAFVPPPPPPLPPCNVQDDAPDTTFLINVNNALNNLESCRSVVTDGEGDMGAIGIQSVIDLGVQQALDVYGVDVSGGATIEICLKGKGGIIYLDARSMPREPQWMPVYSKGDFTCTVIPYDGMVVLVNFNGSPSGSPAASSSAAPAVDALPAGATTLTNCRVTTLNMVNIRPVPSTQGNEPITVVPYDLTLEATARFGEWIRVIYLDFQGWINEAFLSTRGSCG